MYVCICNAVTDADIRREAADGVRSFEALVERTGCSSSCGCCELEARQLLQQAVLDLRTTPLAFVNAA